MSNKVRVRFAPSPTGHLHLGGLRSALFNYLLAKHSHGTFILRIEDTDRERLVPEAVQQIQDSLKWIGINWEEGVGASGDHGPYIQSERLEIYQEHANQLLQKDLAYKDFTSSERLDELRKEAAEKKLPFRFKKSMAQLEPLKAGDKFVIRFEIKEGNDVTWDDAVWGKQSWKRNELDDFVAIKSDGYPTYNFAVVVDDHLMNISHVMRGSEFLSTAPKNILVYEAFGWETPQFVHLPPVLGPDKAKLSKRHGAKSALEYRDGGYLPEAVANYLATLGFNDGTTREIYTSDELADVFTLDRIQSSPAIFDANRLDWMNGMYIRELNIDDLYSRIEDFWPESSKDYEPDYKKRVLELVHDRLKYLSELPELTDFFFKDPKLDKGQLDKQIENSTVLIRDISDTLSGSDFSENDLEEKLREYVSDKNLKTGKVFGLIRLAITGKTAAPGLFETMSTLGKEVVLKRLNSAKELN